MISARSNEQSLKYHHQLGLNHQVTKITQSKISLSMKVKVKKRKVRKRIWKNEHICMKYFTIFIYKRHLQVKNKGKC